MRRVYFSSPVPWPVHLSILILDAGLLTSRALQLTDLY